MSHQEQSAGLQGEDGGGSGLQSHEKVQAHLQRHALIFLMKPPDAAFGEAVRSVDYERTFIRPAHRGVWTASVFPLMVLPPTPHAPERLR